jgi:hypothetical protein
MHLYSFNLIINDVSEYIGATFSTNTQKNKIACVYRTHSCSVSTFLNNLQTIIQQSLEHCPIIIMGNFNVDILKDNNQPILLKKIMDKFQLKSQFSENTTKVGSQLDHIWIGNKWKH